MLTTAVALALSFHKMAWNDYFLIKYARPVWISRLAVDAGAFCLALTFIRAARELTVRLSRLRAAAGEKRPRAGAL